MIQLAMLLQKNLTFKLNFYYNVAKVSKRDLNFKYKKSKPLTPCDLALKHYDVYYKSIFQKKWPSIRLGLLMKEKQVAVINNLVDEEEVKKILETQGAFDLRYFLDSQKQFSKQKDFKQSKIRKGGSENSVKKVIQQTLELTADAEWNEIYSSDKNIKSNSIEIYENVKTDDDEGTLCSEDSMCDLEEMNSSMDSDLIKAEIDGSRLILPASKANSAALYEFVPVTKLRGLEDYISETEYYKYYKQKYEFNINVEKEYEIDFPEYLKIYTFDRGDLSEFSPPTRSPNNVLNYLLMNGADLISVLALNVQPGEIVLDMMCNTGNEALCILQNFSCKQLICRRSEEVQILFKDYLYDFSKNWKNMLLMSSFDWEKESFNTNYDKILLDVVCTGDRESIFNPENNKFALSRKPERLMLPSHQVDLLVKALKMVKKGGTVVYTTKTMCPIQNDGVVAEALRKLWNESKIEFCVKDLSPALEHTTLLFKYSKSIGLKFGILVLPFLPSNFGPRYFSKIVRNS